MENQFRTEHCSNSSFNLSSKETFPKFSTNLPCVISHRVTQPALSFANTRLRSFNNLYFTIPGAPIDNHKYSVCNEPGMVSFGVTCGYEE